MVIGQILAITYGVHGGICADYHFFVNHKTRTSSAQMRVRIPFWWPLSCFFWFSYYGCIPFEPLCPSLFKLKSRDGHVCSTAYMALNYVLCMFHVFCVWFEVAAQRAQDDAVVTLFCVLTFYNGGIFKMWYFSRAILQGLVYKIFYSKFEK